MDSNKAIDLLGGTAKAARFFEVRMPTISEWRHSGFPRARLMYLRAVRPDIVAEASSKPDQKLGAKAAKKRNDV